MVQTVTSQLLLLFFCDLVTTFVLSFTVARALSKLCRFIALDSTIMTISIYNESEQLFNFVYSIDCTDCTVILTHGGCHS